MMIASFNYRSPDSRVDVIFKLGISLQVSGWEIPAESCSYHWWCCCWWWRWIVSFISVTVFHYLCQYIFNGI